jgi:small subunit ribosomal protein S24e
MDITITQKNANPLLHRIDVKGTITFKGTTPSNAQVTSRVAKEVGKTEELVVMKSIYTLFSKQEAKFEAVAYESNEAKVKVEMSTKHLRKQAETLAKKQAQDVAAKKEADEKAAAQAKESTQEVAQENKEGEQ